MIEHDFHDKIIGTHVYRRGKGEMLNQKRTLDEAVKVGFGSFLSFIVGTGVKVVVATMITYYIARDLFQQVVAMF